MAMSWPTEDEIVSDAQIVKSEREIPAGLGPFPQP